MRYPGSKTVRCDTFVFLIAGCGDGRRQDTRWDLQNLQISSDANNFRPIQRATDTLLHVGCGGSAVLFRQGGLLPSRVQGTGLTPVFLYVSTYHTHFLLPRASSHWSVGSSIDGSGNF